MENLNGKLDMVYDLEYFSSRENVSKICSEVSKSLRYVLPFQGVISTTNYIKLDKKARKNIENRYLDYISQKRKLSEICLDNMMGCLSQSLVLKSKLPEWDIFNRKINGVKSQHIVLGKKFSNFYGIIDISSGEYFVNKYKMICNEDKAIKKVYSPSFQSFERDYILSTFL